MVRLVMKHVTTLAEALEVLGSVVGGIVVQMGCRQYDAGGPKMVEILAVWRRALATMTVAPVVLVKVKPATIRKA